MPSKRPFCLAVTCSLAQNTPRACNCYKTNKTAKKQCINGASARGNDITTDRMTSQCNLTQPNTTQPPSNSKSPDCQGHFVMLCVNAARHDCPSSSLHVSRLLSLFCLVDSTIWVSVCYSEKHYIIMASQKFIV